MDNPVYTADGKIHPSGLRQRHNGLYLYGYESYDAFDIKTGYNTHDP